METPGADEWVVFEFKNCDFHRQRYLLRLLDNSAIMFFNTKEDSRDDTP